MKPEVQINIFNMSMNLENKRKLNVNPLYGGITQHNYAHATEVMAKRDPVSHR
jgi:hypothetical protein